MAGDAAQLQVERTQRETLQTELLGARAKYDDLRREMLSLPSVRQMEQLQYTLQLRTSELQAVTGEMMQMRERAKLLESAVKAEREATTAELARVRRSQQSGRDLREVNDVREKLSALQHALDVAESANPGSRLTSPEISSHASPPRDAPAVGVGIVLEEESDAVGFRVREILPGSSAGSAELIKLHDRLVAVDGVTVTGESLLQVKNRIRGSPGSHVTLHFRRPVQGGSTELSKETYSVTLVRGFGRMSVAQPTGQDGVERFVDVPTGEKGGWAPVSLSDVQDARRSISPPIDPNRQFFA